MDWIWTLLGILVVGWVIVKLYEIVDDIMHPPHPMSEEEKQKMETDPWYWEKKAQEVNH